jgi:nicotinamide mononucleotide transporter
MTMNKTLRNNIEAILIATAATCVLLIGIQLVFDVVINLNKGIGSSWLEVAAIWTSFCSTWLCTRQSRYNYIYAAASTILLSTLFWQANLYGSMALNIYLVPTVIYGFFIWGHDSNTKIVEHVKLNVIPIYVAVTVTTWLGAFLIISAVGGRMSMLDGWLLVGSVFAQFLLDRKKIETWAVWALVNVVSIYVYAHSGLYLLAGQFFIFLINTVIAWVAWNKTLVHDEIAFEGNAVLE